MRLTRRAQRVLSMTLFYGFVVVVTIVEGRSHRIAFLVTAGLLVVAVGIVMDRYHERSGHNREP